VGVGAKIGWGSNLTSSVNIGVGAENVFKRNDWPHKQQRTGKDTGKLYMMPSRKNGLWFPEKRGKKYFSQKGRR